APSHAWINNLNTTRFSNRGDAMEWSRFHHHVLIRARADLPLYCCLCRTRKWDEVKMGQ
ncbi:unnamed protein product, partial [Choristocarpus tenellus]